MGNINLQKQRRAQWKKKQNVQYLPAWKRSAAGTRERLDYIMIDKQQRNWVAQVKTKGTSNSEPLYQSKVILLILKIRREIELLGQCGNKRIAHDINALRTKAELLDTYTRQSDIDCNKNITATL